MVQIKFLFISCFCFYFSWIKVGILVFGWFTDWFMYSEWLQDERSLMLWRADRVFDTYYAIFPVETWSNFMLDFALFLYNKLWSDSSTLSTLMIDLILASVRFYPLISSPNFFGYLMLSYLNWSFWVATIWGFPEKDWFIDFEPSCW